MNRDKADDKLTFFKISAKVNDPSSHRRYKQVGDFLLRWVVSAHNEQQLRFVGCNWVTKNGAGDQMGMGER